MHLQSRNQTHSDVVPLRNAVLCVDCESVSSSLFDNCPVCGSHSIFRIAPILGGSLLPAENTRSARDANRVMYDLEFNIGLKQMEAEDVSAMVEGITDLIRAKFGWGRVSFHIDVEPVANSYSEHARKAA
jgi:hypothetical protein